MITKSHVSPIAVTGYSKNNLTKLTSICWSFYRHRKIILNEKGRIVAASWGERIFSSLNEERDSTLWRRLATAKLEKMSFLVKTGHFSLYEMWMCHYLLLCIAYCLFKPEIATCLAHAMRCFIYLLYG